MKDLISTETEIRQRIWVELQRATQDRHHEWRTPVLATTGLDGTPQARTLVLRHADSKPACLHMYTDSRSSKVAELAAAPSARLVFWSKRLSWQLRLQVDVVVQTHGPEVDAAWARLSQSAAAADYLSATVPGSSLAGAQAGKAPPPPQSPLLQEHHLAILMASVHKMDWLELARGAHRRALLGKGTWEWLAP